MVDLNWPGDYACFPEYGPGVCRRAGSCSTRRVLPWLPPTEMAVWRFSSSIVRASFGALGRHSGVTAGRVGCFRAVHGRADCGRRWHRMAMGDWSCSSLRTPVRCSISRKRLGAAAGQDHGQRSARHCLAVAGPSARSGLRRSGRATGGFCRQRRTLALGAGLLEQRLGIQLGRAGDPPGGGSRRPGGRRPKWRRPGLRLRP